MSADLIAVLICAAAALMFLTFPDGRNAWLNHLLLARRMYVEAPLRLMTGRRRPDYAAIARLEREMEDGQ